MFDKNFGSFTPLFCFKEITEAKRQELRANTDILQDLKRKLTVYVISVSLFNFYEKKNGHYEVNILIKYNKYHRIRVLMVTLGRHEHVTVVYNKYIPKV